MYRYVQFVHADFRISVDIPLSSMIHSDYWRTWDGLSTKMPSIWSLCRVGKPTPGLELQKKAAVIRWTKACTPTWFGFLEKMQGALGLMTWQKQTLIEIPRYHQRMVISSLVVKAAVTTQPKKNKGGILLWNFAVQTKPCSFFKTWILFTMFFFDSGLLNMFPSSKPMGHTFPTCKLQPARAR